MLTVHKLLVRWGSLLLLVLRPLLDDWKRLRGD